VLTNCLSHIEQIIVLEGRPRFEGREVARLLSQRHATITLITDAQADIFLPQCHAVVVGADSILANGDILNKAGTALLAWAVRGHRIPFYVLSETLKISPQSWSGDLTQLEEKEPAEVLEQAIAGVSIRNFYFDRTLSRLVTGVITEQGILDKTQIKKIASQLVEKKEKRE
jgi:translation initiation factor 2B subunit (eIF-2B alpha/beta/delta family)